MKVILLEKYRNLGSVGDVIEVKNGYARNFLLPNGKAVQATKQNILSFEEKKAELLEKSKKKEAEAKKVAEKIENKVYSVIYSASDDGRLYGSVSNSDISDKINHVVSTDISRKQIHLTTAIKSLGIYQVEVDLGEGVIANIYLNVSKSEGEASEMEDKFLKGKIGLGSISGKEESKDKSPEQAKDDYPQESAEESSSKEQAEETTQEQQDAAEAEADNSAEDEKSQAQ